MIHKESEDQGDWGGIIKHKEQPNPIVYISLSHSIYGTRMDSERHIDATRWPDHAPAAASLIPHTQTRRRVRYVR